MYLKIIWPNFSYLWFLKVIKILKCFHKILSSFNFLLVVIYIEDLDRKSWFHSKLIEFWRRVHILIGVNSIPLLRGHHYDTTLNTGWIWSIRGKLQYTNVLVISTVKGKDLWSMVNCNYLRSMALNWNVMWINFTDIID